MCTACGCAKPSRRSQVDCTPTHTCDTPTGVTLLRKLERMAQQANQALSARTPQMHRCLRKEPRLQEMATAPDALTPGIQQVSSKLTISTNRLQERTPSQHQLRIDATTASSAAPEPQVDIGRLTNTSIGIATFSKGRL
jgi:hypothetical protein